MTDDNTDNVVDIADGMLRQLQDDDDLWRALWDSDHPAAKRFTRWLTHDLLPTVAPLSGRAPAPYVWPGARADFDAMIREALRAARARSQ